MQRAWKSLRAERINPDLFPVYFSSALHTLLLGLGRRGSSHPSDLWFAVYCAFGVVLELCKAYFIIRWENALQWVDVVFW